MSLAPASVSASSAAAGRAQLGPAEVRVAEDLVMRALRPRGLPYYSPEERLVLGYFGSSYEATTAC